MTTGAAAPGPAADRVAPDAPAAADLSTDLRLRQYVLVTRYLAAVIAVAIAAALRQGLPLAPAQAAPFITFYPAVLIVAVLAGGGPGVTTALLSALWAATIAAPAMSASAASLPDTTAFVVGSLIVCALVQRLHILRRADATTRRRMELLDIAVNSIHEGAIITDTGGRVLFLNAGAANLLGHTPEAASGRPLDEVCTFIDARSGAPLTDVTATILRLGSLVGAVDDVELLTARGEPMSIELSGVPIHATGAPRGIVLTFRDRSERKRLFDAVHAQKERLALVLDSIDDEVYFTDTQQCYVYANPAALREFGHDTVEGIDVSRIIAGMVVLRADGTPRPIREAPPLRALAGEIIRDEDQLVLTPRTGELRHRLVSSAPVRDAAGRIIGAVSVVRDVTDHTRALTALREADRRKNVFLATLSHELRNPLAPIRTAARLLESPLLSHADVERCRSIIARQVGLMASLLDDLMDISRLTRGELILRREPAPLRQIVEAAIETAQPLISARRHRLHTQWPPQPPVLLADPLRLTQVLSNLLTNAARYTPPGGDITFSCQLEPQGLVMLVRDTGIGLSPEKFAEVFQMFSRVATDAQRSEGGLGIGLALVKALVELHDGRVEVHSAGADRGSTFIVTLPRALVVNPDRTAPVSVAADSVLLTGAPEEPLEPRIGA